MAWRSVKAQEILKLLIYYKDRINVLRIAGGRTQQVILNNTCRIQDEHTAVVI
jgi:hypothetical protein